CHPAATLVSILSHTSLFRSLLPLLAQILGQLEHVAGHTVGVLGYLAHFVHTRADLLGPARSLLHAVRDLLRRGGLLLGGRGDGRSEEHTSELQSRESLVCRL